MRVLLSNPPWFPENGKRWGIRAGSRWPFTVPEGSGYYPYPFLLGYATSTLRRQAVKAWMVDSILTRESVKGYFERLVHVKFDYVVIETSTPSIEWDLRIADTIHDHGLARVILVGPHATVFADELIQRPSIHAVTKGAYELNLLDAVTSGGPGVYDYKLVDDIDSLPFPYRDTTTYGYQDRFPSTPKGPMLQMWGSRGCPHRCVFCLWPPVMYQNRYLARRPQAILSEIEEVLARYPRFSSLYFDDDTFNIGNERMLELCEGLSRMGLPWAAMCRADTTPVEVFEQMHRSGCYAVKLGVESGCQELVDRCNKKLDLKTVEKVVRELKRMGVFVHLTFTFGLPGETRQTVKQTRAFVRRLRPDTAQVSTCTPFPGTPYYGRLKEETKLALRDWTLFDGARTDMLSNLVDDMGMSCDELRQIGKLDTSFFVWGRMQKQHMGLWLMKSARQLGFIPIGVDCLNPEQEALDALLEASPLDIFLVDSGENLHPDLLQRVTARKILYYPEFLPHKGLTNSHAEARYAQFKTIAPYFDHIILHDSQSIPYLQEQGHKNIVGHVLLPYEPALHRPLDMLKVHDVTFVGLSSPHRTQWVDVIRTRFPVHWPQVWAENYVRTINQSKIMLNLHYTELPNTEHRIVEAMACGAFVLSEPISQPDLFDEGKEIVFFDRKNIFDLLTYYLSNEEERKSIAAAGHRKVWNNFSATSQLKHILTLCGELVD